MFENRYKGKRVLVTGHTGFKGSWLSFWLTMLGAEVAGYSHNVPTSPANFEILDLEKKMQHHQGDIRDRDTLQGVLATFRPEIIFHLAAQSLVRYSYDNPVLTFETNTIGSLNILECIRNNPEVKACVLITSDKCYRNLEWTWGYRENDILGGEDPYSSSKGCAELITYSYINSFFQSGEQRISTTRAGNVIGGGDWAQDRIVPDIVRSWVKGLPARIRNPHATRPWQHVLEPLSGYLWLGAKLLHRDPATVGQAFNFGPSVTVNQSVQDLVRALVEHWPEGKWTIDESPGSGKQESKLLKLCCDKALNILNWHAVLDFFDTVRLTAQWYKTYYKQGAIPMQNLTVDQIAEYQDRAANQGLEWAKK